MIGNHFLERIELGSVLLLSILSFEVLLRFDLLLLLDGTKPKRSKNNRDEHFIFVLFYC